ncbi:MAG: sigma-70 family RNA polymerase sigma factor [Bacteroidia bacterium]
MNSHVSTNDLNLIKKCLLEDRMAQQEFYKQYASKMFAICLRYSKNREDAEDILQEGFIKVYNNLKNFKAEGSLEGWVKRIMINTALLHYRKNLKYDKNTDLEAAEWETQTADAFSALSAKELLTLVQQLPDGYRMVFNLYALEGYQHKEIGDMLGINEGTSKSQLARARKYLIDLIKKSEK